MEWLMWGWLERGCDNGGLGEWGLLLILASSPCHLHSSFPRLAFGVELADLLAAGRLCRIRPASGLSDKLLLVLFLASVSRGGGKAKLLLIHRHTLPP
jgi:hypothetical protein